MIKDDFPVTVGSPFHFEWWVDQHGYELSWTDLMPDSDPLGPLEAQLQIRRKGGPLRAYRPFEENPGLFIEFGHLPLEPSMCWEFARQYGFLGTSLRLVKDPQRIETENVSDWFRAIASVGRLVGRIMEALERSEPVGSLAQYFNENFAQRVRYTLDCKPGSTPVPSVVPETLYGAMVLQLSTQITGGKRYKRCKACPTYYPYGPGTGAKSTKTFCSTRCRVAWNRKNKRNGAVSQTVIGD